MLKKPGELFLYDGNSLKFVCKKYTNSKVKNGKRYFTYLVVPLVIMFKPEYTTPGIGIDYGDKHYTDIFV